MTRGPNIGAFIRLAVAGLTLLVVPLKELAAAQGRPAPVVEFAAGWVGFADDGVVSEGLVGGAGRWYVLPRISVGPEVVYIAVIGVFVFIKPTVTSWHIVSFSYQWQKSFQS